MKIDPSNPALLVFAALFVWCAAAAPANAAAVFLRAEARVVDQQVTLADVAVLRGEYAERLGDLEVAQLEEDDEQQDLTLRQLRDVLREAGVHWGRLTVRGYRQCTIRRQAARESTGVEEQAREEAPASAMPEPLRARLVEMIADLADAGRDELRVHFRERDVKRLDELPSGARLEFEPATASGVGRVPVVVRQHEGDRETDRFTLTADVERRVTALVATRTIARGQRLKEEHFEQREIYLDTDRGQPLSAFELVDGRRSDTVLREGAVVYPHHVRSPRLVRRGEQITVRASAGDLMVRTSARARDSGVKGDVIRVRNERTREPFTVRITGRREAVVHARGGADADAARE